MEDSIAVCVPMKRTQGLAQSDGWVVYLAIGGCSSPSRSQVVSFFVARNSNMAGNPCEGVIRDCIDERESVKIVPCSKSDSKNSVIALLMAHNSAECTQRGRTSRISAGRTLVHQLTSQVSRSALQWQSSTLEGRIRTNARRLEV